MPKSESESESEYEEESEEESEEEEAPQVKSQTPVAQIKPVAPVPVAQTQPTPIAKREVRDPRILKLRESLRKSLESQSGGPSREERILDMRVYFNLTP